MRDLIYKVASYINGLDVPYPVSVGLFEEEASLVVRPTAGFKVVQTYMNKERDLCVPFEIGMKSKDQEVAQRVLHEVADHMQHFDAFLQKDAASKLHLTSKTHFEGPPVFEKADDGYVYGYAQMRFDVTELG